MHQVRKGVERLVASSSSSRLRHSLGSRLASSGKTGGDTPANKGKGLGSTIQKSPASTATASQLDRTVEATRPPVERPERKRGVPLDVPFPGTAVPTDVAGVKDDRAYERAASFSTEVTTLDNGLKVGTTLRYGKYCTIGVTIKSGSRYETGFTKGISHVAEKLGFLSSRNFKTKPEIMKELEKFGAICDSQTSRDTTVYAVSTEVDGVESLMRLLADVVLRPTITDDELLNAQQTVQYEHEDMQMRPEQEMIILEMIHAAAWNNNTLGFPRYCPPENAEQVSRQQILQFMKTNFQPSTMAVSGVGVDHKLLVDLAKEYFVTNDTTWDSEGIKGKEQTDLPSVYTGGDNRVMKDFGQFNAGPLPVPKLAHMALGIKSVPYSDANFIPACVLNILMGGGGSFSAGGPGKGMYSRLYTNVLNNKHWVYNATAYNNSYIDSGLFCIYGSAPPEYMRKLTEVLIQELHGMGSKPDAEEFERAKKQLQSMLLMNLESRPVVFEDIGRQLLAHGFYKPPIDYLKLIEDVKESDVTSLAQSMLKSKPALAALGDVSRVPPYNEILTRQEYLREPSKMFFTR